MLELYQFTATGGISPLDSAPGFPLSGRADAASPAAASAPSQAEAGEGRPAHESAPAQQAAGGNAYAQDSSAQNLAGREAAPSAVSALPASSGPTVSSGPSGPSSQVGLAEPGSPGSPASPGQPEAAPGPDGNKLTAPPAANQAEALLAERLPKDFGFGSIWADLQNPTPEELEKVSDGYGIPLTFLTDSLDPEERPHALSDEGICLVICKVSLRNSEDETKPFRTVPLGIIITHDVVLTVCALPGVAREFVFKAWGGAGGKPAVSFRADGPAREAAKTGKGAPGEKSRVIKDTQRETGKAPGKAAGKENARESEERCRPGVELALRVLQESSIRFIRHLQELDRLTEEIEQRMHRSMRNADLALLMQVEKSLVYFATSLKGNLGVLDKIGSNQMFSLREAEKQLLTDAMIESKQAADMAQIYLEIISSISDTSASMISNNMNVIMKFLTAITLIMTVPTVIVGAYGMNVPLPFQESSLALWLILAFTVGVCWLLWRYFVKKHWM